MDTFTHGVLGVCVAEMLGNKETGKKILVLGAVAQIFPDIDVLAALWLDPAANVLAHRGLTHSFIFILMSAPAIAWLISRYWPTVGSFRYWVTFLSIQFLVHDLIDGFNAYGTGWLEPFVHTRYAFHSLFVADPVFSIPLLVAAILLLFQESSGKRKYLQTGIALTVSLSYLAGCLYVRDGVQQKVSDALMQQKIGYDEMLVTPTPFNSLLWFVATQSDSGSYVGYRSVFDGQRPMVFHYFPRNDSLLRTSSRQPEIRNLQQFSQGYYTVEQRGDTLLFNDLRFGQIIGWQNPKAGFVFHYYLNPDLDNTVVLQRGRFAGWKGETVAHFLNRIRGQ